eukprot:GFUD01062854.1.p1 GENE.GFUD01062854.1~~GFUD01062854.1.p1  ORF type:complete len:205 (-),score=46.24 GFUD01062854.1:132-746(-)
MSVPSGSAQTPVSLVPKPSLPSGWSCHVSKSVPGKCYYFNRFTGAKTWELGELLPGHSDTSAPAPGSAPHPITEGDTQHRQYQAVHRQPDHQLDQTIAYQVHQQLSHQQPQNIALDADVASLGVVELEALLVEQKRKLQEMAGNPIMNPAPGQSVSCSSTLVNRSVDSSSTESGFVEEDGGTGRLGLMPGIGNSVRSETRNQSL